MMRAWLDHYRDIMVFKIEGLDAEQARFRPTVTGISLLNLLVHLTGVDRGWVEGVIGGREIERDRDAEFREIELSVAEAIAAFREQCARSNEIIDRASLDDRMTGQYGTYSVRWVLQHLLEEYARHAGHADITRELIDGATGYSRTEKD